MHDIGILVVTFNQYEITRNFIINFSKYFSPDKYYLLILDNDSSDRTYEKIKYEFPWVDIRLLNGNYGCVTGRNIGIVELINAGVKYIYISDNDIEFNNPNFFEKMKNFTGNNPGIIGCCPVVKWASGKMIQTVGARILSLGRMKYINEISGNDDINILPGCAQFIKAEAFEKYGVFDNDLTPISIEDLEWGIRATKRGAKFKFNAGAEVIHLHEVGKKSSPAAMKFIIDGRIVFLKNYFNFFFLLREVKHFFYCVAGYGFSYSFKNYLSGFKKKINQGNYKFDTFKDKVNKYYK